MNAGLEKMSFRVLQDLPAVRPRRYEGAGDRRARASSAATSSRRSGAGGHQVTALVRSPAKAAALETARRARGARETSTTPARSRAPSRARTSCIHVAGLVAARSEAEFLAVNRDGTRDVAGGGRARAERPRFVLRLLDGRGRAVRAGAVRYAATSRRSPVTAYGRSKLAAETVRDRGSAPLGHRAPARRSTDRATGKCSRSSGWPARASPRCSATAARSSRRCTAPTWRARSSPRAPHRRDRRQDLLPLPSRDRHQRRCSSARSAQRWGGGSRVVPRSGDRSAAALLGVTEAAAASSPAGPRILTPDKANEFFQPAWTGDPARSRGTTRLARRARSRIGLADTVGWYRSAGWL